MPLVRQQPGANNMLWLPGQLSKFLTLALFRHMKWHKGYLWISPLTKIRLVYKTVVKRCRRELSLNRTVPVLYWDVFGRSEPDPVKNHPQLFLGGFFSCYNLQGRKVQRKGTRASLLFPLQPFMTSSRHQLYWTSVCRLHLTKRFHVPPGSPGTQKIDLQLNLLKQS